jgi:hypothetical protein
MSTESKQGFERYYGALSRKYTPDRVPVACSSDGYVFPKWYGSTPGEMNRNHSLVEFIKKAVAELGAWDVDIKWSLYNSTLDWETPMKFLVPGVQLPDDSPNVADEKELMGADAYDKIIERGWMDYWRKDIWPEVMNMPMAGTGQSDFTKEYEAAITPIEQTLEDEKKITEEIGMEPSGGTTNQVVIIAPFFTLSMGRSFTPFTEDLFFKKDKVEKAIKIMSDYQIGVALKKIELTGSKSVLYCEERGSAYMYPLHIFERFWLPYALEFVEAVWSKGVMTTMHLDTNWIKNLPYFKQFPKNSVCIQFDSTTPIFEARKLLGDHIQYWGDVPASLLAYGTPEEVTAYCNRLIKEVGKDGGFVLGGGCEVPSDCKKENFRAMLEAARNSKY